MGRVRWGLGGEGGGGLSGAREGGRGEGRTHVPAIVVGALAQNCWLRGR